MADVCNAGEAACSFLVLHSVTHSVGVVLLVYGLAAKRKLLVRDDVGWAIAPTHIGSAPGLAVRGEF
jgi:hypothetical protein